MLQLSHLWSNISASYFTGAFGPGGGGGAWFRSVLICFCNLFNDAVSKSVYVALVTDSELDMLLKSAVVACLNMLSRTVSGGTQVKQ